MTTTATLYERLGGADKIRAIVNDIMTAHYANPQIKTRFESIEDRSAVTKRAFEFFAAGTGGPFIYQGRDMPSTDKGMNIYEPELLAAIDDILMVLRKHQVGEREQQEVLAVLYSLKDEVLHK